MSKLNKEEIEFITKSLKESKPLPSFNKNFRSFKILDTLFPTVPFSIKVKNAK
jgi:hypothetical protein